MKFSRMYGHFLNHLNYLLGVVVKLYSQPLTQCFDIKKAKMLHQLAPQLPTDIFYVCFYQTQHVFVTDRCFLPFDTGSTWLLMESHNSRAHHQLKNSSSMLVKNIYLQSNLTNYFFIKQKQLKIIVQGDGIFLNRDVPSFEVVILDNNVGQE